MRALRTSGNWSVPYTKAVPVMRLARPPNQAWSVDGQPQQDEQGYSYVFHNLSHAYVCSFHIMLCAISMT